jgi:CP family cyanate transporter-like MFS transporter
LTARGRAVLAVAGVVTVAFNMRTAIASVPPLLDDLGLGAAGQSLLVTIPILCFALGALAGPRLRAWLGEERAIFAVLAAMLAGVALRGAWPDAALLPGTILAGLGIAGLNVLLPSLVKRRFRDHVGPLTAAYTTTLSIGAGVAASVTVPVLDGAGGAPGPALALWALPALLGLVVWVPQLRLAGGTVRGPAVRRGDARAIWRQPLAWLVMLFMGLQSITFYGPLSWLPAILRDHGVDPTHAGVLLGVMTTISMVGSTISPVVAVRSRDQRAVTAVSVAIVGAGLLGLLLAPASAPLLWALLLGLGQGACFGLALLLIVLRAADEEAAAQLSSMAQAGGYVVAAAGPLAMGLLHAVTGGWTAPLLFLLAATAGQLVAGLGASRDRLVRHERAMA